MSGSGLPQVVVHTDGGCRGNPGLGAWACILDHAGLRWERSGAVPDTTNNRMELQAAIEALRLLNRPCLVALYTDSDYLRQGITAWIKGWKRNGWVTSTKDPVKNRDQWEELDRLSGRHTIHWHWLKGHAGHPLNERCDLLANRAMDAFRRERPGVQHLR